MKRLTVPYEYGDGYRSKCAETCGECDGCWGLDEIVNRLGAYEDTELTPEEVNDAVAGAKLMAKAQLVSAFGVAAERLRELAEADKAGRLVVLPKSLEVYDKPYGYDDITCVACERSENWEWGVSDG